MGLVSPGSNVKGVLLNGFSLIRNTIVKGFAVNLSVHLILPQRFWGASVCGSEGEPPSKQEATMASTKVQRIMTQPIVNYFTLNNINNIVTNDYYFIRMLPIYIFFYFLILVLWLQNLIFRFLQSVSIIFKIYLFLYFSNKVVFFVCNLWFLMMGFKICWQKARIQIWLFEQKDLRIEGRIIVCSFHFFNYCSYFFLSLEPPVETINELKW